MTSIEKLTHLGKNKSCHLRSLVNSKEIYVKLVFTDVTEIITVFLISPYYNIHIIILKMTQILQRILIYNFGLLKGILQRVLTHIFPNFFFNSYCLYVPIDLQSLNLFKSSFHILLLNKYLHTFSIFS